MLPEPQEWTRLWTHPASDSQPMGHLMPGRIWPVGKAGREGRKCSHLQISYREQGEGREGDRLLC